MIVHDRTRLTGPLRLVFPATGTVLAQSITMMKQIDKKVLVEGVETRAQAEALRAMGADYIQGYLYARPLPQNEFVDFLLRNNA